MSIDSVRLYNDGVKSLTKENPKGGPFENFLRGVSSPFDISEEISKLPYQKVTLPIIGSLSGAIAGYEGWLFGSALPQGGVPLAVGAVAVKACSYLVDTYDLMLEPSTYNMGQLVRDINPFSWDYEL